MPYRVVDLKYSAELGAIDGEPLERIVGSCEVLQATEHFYVLEGLPHLIVGVHFRPPQAAPRRSVAHAGPPRSVRAETAAASSGAPTSGPHWMEIIQEGNRPLFESLRSWRRKRAQADAVPPYVVLTNVQLAQVANRRPATLSALKEIDGLGNGRAERFGRELLEAIAGGASAPAGNRTGDAVTAPALRAEPNTGGGPS